MSIKASSSWGESAPAMSWLNWPCNVWRSLNSRAPAGVSPTWMERRSWGLALRLPSGRGQGQQPAREALQQLTFLKQFPVFPQV